MFHFLQAEGPFLGASPVRCAEQILRFEVQYPHEIFAEHSRLSTLSTATVMELAPDIFRFQHIKGKGATSYRLSPSIPSVIQSRAWECSCLNLLDILRVTVSQVYQPPTTECHTFKWVWRAWLEPTKDIWAPDVAHKSNIWISYYEWNHYDSRRIYNNH